MDLYLNNKTAVVTGASQGIGRAIASTLAYEGVKVLLMARNENLLADLRNEIMATGGVQPEIFVHDFLSNDGPQRIAEAAMSSLGHVDILVNNVGRSRPLEINGSEDEWRDGMALDFDRHRQLTQQLLPGLIKRKQGSILNITSTYELRSINVSAVAKASIVMWSKQLAGQLGRHGITINCLQPGLIDTANTRRVFSAEKKMKFAATEIPMGDFGEPQDIANMATFLVSPRAKYVTGSVAVVDGGMRHHPF